MVLYGRLLLWKALVPMYLAEDCWNAVHAAVGANGQRFCPSACIDLSQYPFMKSSACVCNSPVVKSIAQNAGDARRHFGIAVIGALFCLGPSYETFALHVFKERIVSACILLALATALCNLSVLSFIEYAGLFVLYLGSILLLSRLSAEGAKIRFDLNLLWSNRFDWYGSQHLLQLSASHGTMHMQSPSNEICLFKVAACNEGTYLKCLHITG
jgi:hypothetical protein